MKKLALLLIVAAPQVFAEVPEPKKYRAEQVVDLIYGITMYEKLNPQIGGDSTRNNNKGYAMQGWTEDYYESGATLHQGFYEEGQLKIYRNFYENGNVERSFKIIDFKKCEMQLFYPDGKLKSEVTYYSGNVLKGVDYYKSGQIKYIIENNGSNEYLISRKSYAEDGKPQELFELINLKKKIYSHKEFYENGNVKVEGEMKFNPYKVDYIKDGTWKIYGEQGKVIKQENWVYGEQRKH